MANDLGSYIVFEQAKDWDGNKIAILGRFHAGDRVIVSKEFRERVHSEQLAGVQTIDSYFYQYRTSNPPRYWHSGLAQYTVRGQSWLIPDDQLTLATEEDMHKETLMRINQEIKKHFDSYYMDVQPVLQMSVWRALGNQESPTDADIRKTLEQVIARSLGVQMEGDAV